MPASKDTYHSKLYLIMIIIIIVGLPITSASVSSVSDQNLLLSIKDIYVITEVNGHRISSTNVYLFVLSGQDDWVLVDETYTLSTGVARLRPVLAVDKARNYSPINLMVIARKGDYLGVYMFAINYSVSSPLYVHVNMVKLNGTIKESSLNDLSGSSSTVTKYTTVLEYSTCNSIYAQWHYPVGAKIKVQSKWRWPPGSGSWINGGYTEVALDLGTQSGTRTGNYIRKLQFLVTYRHTITPIGGIAIEEVYAVDTDNDGAYYRRLEYPWSCTPTSGSKSAIVYQGDTKEIPVTGGENYDFYVTVSFSYPWTATVTLGVDKTKAPQATLTIQAGYRSDPDYVVKIVSIGDSDYLRSRAFWIKQTS